MLTLYGIKILTFFLQMPLSKFEAEKELEEMVEELTTESMVWNNMSTKNISFKPVQSGFFTKSNQYFL